MKVQNQSVEEIVRHFGSAFFIGSGYFLTARHVLESIHLTQLPAGHSFGLITKAKSGMSADSEFTYIKSWERAPEPYDIAIGSTNFQFNPDWKFHRRATGVWTDVATFGYPESAVRQEGMAKYFNLRFLKGYVQRLLDGGDVPGKSANAPSYELSFLISPGLSGSPLVLATADTPIIGVCTGAYQSTHTDHELIEVEESGNTYKETRLRVEQYSCADRLEGLLDWRPKILGGRTLGEMLP